MTEEERSRGQRLFDRLGRPFARNASEVPDSFRLGFEELLQARGHVVGLSVLDAWVVLSLCQLALRHPLLGEPLRAHGARIARVLTKRVVQVAPQMAEWIEKGWDPDYDVMGSDG